MQEKNQQRKIIRDIKQNFNDQVKLNKSEKIFHQVEKIPEFIKAKTILAYWSLPDEVNTHPFVLKWHKEKRVILPVVNGNELDLKVFSGLESMEKGSSFGILEPTSTEVVTISDIDFAIVPGVAFDLQGNRLGRGKGYYDKLLSNNKLFKVGICFSFQLLPNVAVSEFDIPMDQVIYA